MSLSWSARAPWFPAVGISLAQCLPPEGRSYGLLARVEESNPGHFTVEVWSPVCRKYVTFRKVYWSSLTKEARIAWVERDLKAAAEAVIKQDRASREAVKKTMSKAGAR